MASPKISAVVPLFMSESYVRPCLESLVAYLPEGSEIIAVDDGSPDRSAEIAQQVLTGYPHALITYMGCNRGFARAVNAGARRASGDYLLMFNADAEARPGFIEPMLAILEEQADVAIVGNRHVDALGRVDSEGSEFSWKKRERCGRRLEARNYQHVGRDIDDPVPGAGAKDRDVVTFACALIRASVWHELGGLDEEYRKAYYEDGDFCLRARSRGWRVVYTPDSEVLHHGKHAKAGGHEWYHDNRRLFRKRWVETGLVGRFARERGLRVHEGRVVACVIACSEEEWIASAIESVYPLADRIVVVEGGNPWAVEAGLCDPRGCSTDGTVREVTFFPDPEGKVVGIHPPGRPWRDKREQRNRYLVQVCPGDWMILLDADEVFSEQGLWRLSAFMHTKADIISPGFHLHWNEAGTLGTGRWADYRQVKVVRWRAGWSYDCDHNMPCDRDGRPITEVPGVRHLRPTGEEPLYHHYSWCGRDVARLRAKARYYELQNAGEKKRPFPPDYVDRVLLPWREGDERTRRDIERRYGTHPYGGGGTEPFKGEHPEAVRRRLRDLTVSAEGTARWPTQ